MKPIIKCFIALNLLLVLTACNTVQGVGQDISCGGKAIARAAR